MLVEYIYVQASYASTVPVDCVQGYLLHVPLHGAC